MRHGLVCSVLLVAACSGELPDTPVDMQFRVAIEQLENSCGDAENYKTDEGYTAIVDVFLRSNGNVNIGNNSFAVPGYSVYKDVPLKNGKVAYRLKVETSTPGKTNDHLLEGTVTPEHLDLTIAVNAQNWSADGADCVRKTHLTGDPRPISDPAVLDGFYAVTVDDYGYACVGDPARTSVGQSRMLMEVDQYMPDKSVFYFGQLAWGGQPDAQGALESSFSSFAGFFEIEGTVKGIFKPDDVDLSFESWFFGNTDCTTLAYIKGAKRLPDPDRIDNEYRAAFSMNDGCALGIEGTETSVHLLTQADGKVVLVDPYLGGVEAALTADGQLSYTDGSEAQGAVLTMSGSVSPPNLDYTVEYKQETDPGTWCTVTYTTAANVRYVSE